MAFFSDVISDFSQGTCVLEQADGVRKMSGTEEGLKQIAFRGFICMHLSLWPCNFANILQNYFLFGR